MPAPHDTPDVSRPDDGAEAGLPTGSTTGQDAGARQAPAAHGHEVFPARGGAEARRLLQELGPGVRVSVRYRIEDGFTDAVGELQQADEERVVVATRRGTVEIPLAQVAAARRIPPALPRRRPRSDRG